MTTIIIIAVVLLGVWGIHQFYKSKVVIPTCGYCDRNCKMCIKYKKWPKCGDCDNNCVNCIKRNMPIPPPPPAPPLRNKKIIEYKINISVEHISDIVLKMLKEKYSK